MSRYEYFFSNYDESYLQIYYNSWSGYEDSEWIFIFEKDQKYFYILGGEYCGSENQNYRYDFLKDLCEINFEQAFEIMEKWEKIEKENL